MSILYEWTIKNHNNTNFANPLVIESDRVVIRAETSGNHYFEAYHQGATNYYLRGRVTYDAGADSISGKFLYDSVDYEVNARAKTFGDHIYIFGFARNFMSAEESGGQWDGNRPR